MKTHHLHRTVELHLLKRNFVSYAHQRVCIFRVTSSKFQTVLIFIKSQKDKRYGTQNKSGGFGHGLYGKVARDERWREYSATAIQRWPRTRLRLQQHVSASKMPPTNSVKNHALWLPSHRNHSAAASFFLIAAILLCSVDHTTRLFSTMPDSQNHLGRPPPYAAVYDDEKVDHQSPGANSVCHLFKRSLGRYEALLLALQAESLRSTRLGIMLVPEVKDDFSRLRIWGEQTYAVFPQGARRSLDEQLRGDEDTKRIVLRSLRRLNSYIEKGCVRIHIAVQS